MDRRMPINIRFNSSGNQIGLVFMGRLVPPMGLKNNIG